MSDEQAWRQQLKGVRAFVETLKEPEAEQRDTASIAGKFAEALGHIEDALCYLGQVNEEYDPEQYPDDIPLVAENGLRPYPVTDFWLWSAWAEGTLKNTLGRLQRVEPLAPKEGTR